MGVEDEHLRRGGVLQPDVEPLLHDLPDVVGGHLGIVAEQALAVGDQAVAEPAMFSCTIRPRYSAGTGWELSAAGEGVGRRASACGGRGRIRQALRRGGGVFLVKGRDVGRDLGFLALIVGGVNLVREPRFQKGERPLGHVYHRRDERGALGQLAQVGGKRKNRHDRQRQNNDHCDDGPKAARRPGARPYRFTFPPPKA